MVLARGDQFSGRASDGAILEKSPLAKKKVTYYVFCVFSVVF